MAHIRSPQTVASALVASDAGVPDAENAARHQVAVKTIRRWRRLYQRRSLIRGQQHLAPPCPRCDGALLDEPAYAELLGWYPGDGYVSTGRRGVFNLPRWEFVNRSDDIIDVCIRAVDRLGLRWTRPTSTRSRWPTPLTFDVSTT